MGKNRYYVDFRFIVDEAEDISDAADKADALIKEATDEVWYTIAKVTKLQRNSNWDTPVWQTCQVKWEDPRKERVRSSCQKVINDEY